jgi:hypothetical protein
VRCQHGLQRRAKARLVVDTVTRRDVRRQLVLLTPAEQDPSVGLGIVGARGAGAAAIAVEVVEVGVELRRESRRGLPDSEPPS